MAAGPYNGVLDSDVCGKGAGEARPLLGEGADQEADAEEPPEDHVGPPQHLQPLGYEDFVRRAEAPASEPPGPPEAAAERAGPPEAGGHARGRRVPMNKARSAGDASLHVGGSLPPSRPRCREAPQRSAAPAASGLRRPKSQLRPGERVPAAAEEPCSDGAPMSGSSSLARRLALGRAGEGRRPLVSREAAARAGPQRLARQASPATARPARTRPLPLEISHAPGPRSHDSGSAGGVPAGGQPLSSGSAAPSSARRGRRPNRLVGKPSVEEESISPSPNAAAARRRRDLTTKTLHKTAEIYGVQGLQPHSRLAPAPRGAERAEEPSRPQRSEDDEAEKAATTADSEPSPGASPVDAADGAGPADGEAGAEVEDARHGGGAHLPPCHQRTRPLRSVETVGAPRSHESLPPVVQDVGADALHGTPKSSESQAEAARAFPRFPELAAVDGSADAWCAFSSTVRHTDGPPLCSLFQGVEFPPPPLPPRERTSAPGFELSLAPRSRAGLEAEAAGPATVAPAASRPAEARHAEAGSDSSAASPWSRGGWEEEEPPEEIEESDEASSVEEEEGGAVEEAQVVEVAQGRARRIKSSSPPGRWRRPRPLNLDRRQADQQPSSAPSDFEGHQHRRLEPLQHMTQPSAAVRQRAVGVRQGGGAALAALAAMSEPRPGDPAAAPPPQQAPSWGAPAAEDAGDAAGAPWHGGGDQGCRPHCGGDQGYRPFTPPVVPVSKLLRSVFGGPGRPPDDAAAKPVVGDCPGVGELRPRRSSEDRV